MIVASCEGIKATIGSGYCLSRGSAVWERRLAACELRVARGLEGGNEATSGSAVTLSPTGELVVRSEE